MTTSRDGFSLESLVSPFGVVADVGEMMVPAGLRRVSAFCSLLGSGVPGTDFGGRVSSGFGLTIDASPLARLISVAEAAERYSLAPFRNQPVVWARASEMCGNILDPGRVPRCSDREYSHPSCPFVPFDSAARVRWMQGVELTSGEAIWLPAIMGWYGLPNIREEERFWYPISTGCAVHTDIAEALIRGILEVIERDAVTIAWLQKLSLPEIYASSLSEKARYLIEWSDRHFIETHVFDATTDLAVPTVFCLQLSAYDDQASQVVGSASARSIAAAAEKALLEAVMMRERLDSEQPGPETRAEIKSLVDSSLYMGSPGRRQAFDFLLASAGKSGIDHARLLPDASELALRCLIDTMSAKGMQVIAVDHTSRELHAAGLAAVCVVIPDLLPMSLWPYGQFRAHPRLTTAPAAMGHPSLPEEELNPWPLPFA